MNDNDILDSVGGSLLNDLLSDLNAAVAADNNEHNRNNNTSDDLLFGLLERELTNNNVNTTTATGSAPGAPPPFMGTGMMMSSPPPGMQRNSAAAFVVNQQAQNNIASGTGNDNPTTPNNNNISNNNSGNNNDDAWSAALTQFGGMSLASDFLAADTASKKKDVVNNNMNNSILSPPPGGTSVASLVGENITSNVVSKLFEDDEDYALEDEVVVFNSNNNNKNNDDGTAEEDDGTMGGLMTLLGAAAAASSSSSGGVGGGSNNKVAPTSTESSEGSKQGAMMPPKNDMAIPPGVDGVPPVVVGSPPLIPGVTGPPPPPGAVVGPPPPGHFFPPPPSGMGYPLMPMPPPPGVAHGMMPPPPHPMLLNNAPPLMMNPPPPQQQQPGMVHPSQQQPGIIMAHPPTMQQPVMVPPPPQGGEMLNNRDFPALGDDNPPPTKNSDDVTTAAANEDAKEEFAHQPNGPVGSIPPTPLAVQGTLPPQRSYFNNANPAARPVSANEVASKFMPSRDVCYIVHSMLRPLQSLDAYNDDYYHWSVANRKSMMMRGPPGVGMAPPGVGGTTTSQAPQPVWKEVKAITKERDEKFLSSMKDRAKLFAEEKKSLGQLVKTNVKRPKALLTTPVLNKENVQDNAAANEDDAARKTDSKYESEQRRHRIQLWKARVRVDKGYSAFLSLIELRRLIQAHAGAPRLANDLMADVKTNVDLLHSSLGVAIGVERGNAGGKTIDVDEATLAGTLSLPKGRALCARVIEEGILPHPSACRLLPAALGCILSWPAGGGAGGGSATSAEGEDRLLHALTGLVLTPQPRMDPSALYRCLDMSVSMAKASQNDNSEDDGRKGLSAITGSHMRAKLLYSVLSVGKEVCGGSTAEVHPGAMMGESWSERESTFLEIIASAQTR